ncbi:MAG TPA: hypothetical protein P5555_21465, partial [Candidatus Paceibacterota bacterium]|nr:hypothetical protein [Candidatus Paceibacterota bacterium]
NRIFNSPLSIRFQTAAGTLVTTSITIPEDLFGAGKSRAEQQFRSFSQYVRNLIHQDVLRASHRDSRHASMRETDGNIS